MNETPLFLRVLEVAPSFHGEGVAMLLLWDGDRRAHAVGFFNGQEVTAEITPARLLHNVRSLQEQACQGRLQIAYQCRELVVRLKAATDNCSATKLVGQSLADRS